MTPLYKQYENTAPIGVYGTCNFGGLEILDIIHGIDDVAIAAWNFGDGRQGIRRHKINYTFTGRAYIRKGGTRYYFDQIIRTGAY